MSVKLADIRKEYTLKTLDETSVLKNPIDQFKLWFQEAIDSAVNEPNAMHLGTIDENNQPNGRIVLLKSCDNDGFTFFTNYQSRKGSELLARPFASLTFFWAELERQVRVKGNVSLVSGADSDQYFHSRPRGSQIGAWVSDQSRAITSRDILEERQRKLEEEFKNKEVPRPPHWGGFLLKPEKIEFWQGRPSRLHDRICFSKKNMPDGSWNLERLAP